MVWPLDNQLAILDGHSVVTQGLDPHHLLFATSGGCGTSGALLHLRLGLYGGVGAGLGLDYVGISLDCVRLCRTLYSPTTTGLNYLSRFGKQLLRLLLDQLRLTRLARYQFDLLLRLGGGLDDRVLTSLAW